MRWDWTADRGFAEKQKVSKMEQTECKDFQLKHSINLCFKVVWQLLKNKYVAHWVTKLQSQADVSEVDPTLHHNS